MLTFSPQEAGHMPTHSSTHFFLNWAKERADEMDAALASLEAKAKEVKADLRAKSDRALADLRKTRDDFKNIVQKQSDAGEAAWESAKSRLDADWVRFETEVQKYVETFGEQAAQRQAMFKLQAEAQLKAWHEAADKMQVAADKFAADRRSDIDATLASMKAGAAAAEERLQKLNQAGNESWSTLVSALTETRAIFDRANQQAREAFRKAAG
jgi:hypothetical protein